MTASSVRENGAAAVESNTSKEIVSIAAPTMELVGEEARSIDPNVEKRVLRKIDLFLMPAMVTGQLSDFVLDTSRTLTYHIMQDTVLYTTTRLS